MRCNVMRRDALYRTSRYGILCWVQCGVGSVGTQCNVMQRNGMQCAVLYCIVAQCNAMECDVMHCKVMQCSVRQRNVL